MASNFSKEITDLSVSSITDLHVPCAPLGTCCVLGVVDPALGGHRPRGTCQAAVNVLVEDKVEKSSEFYHIISWIVIISATYEN